jgi:hypothetical protein
VTAPPGCEVRHRRLVGETRPDGPAVSGRRRIRVSLGSAHWRDYRRGRRARDGRRPRRGLAPARIGCAAASWFFMIPASPSPWRGVYLSPERKVRMKHRVCPWWAGYLLASPLRRLLQDPARILAPLVQEGMRCSNRTGHGFFTLRAGAAGRPRWPRRRGGSSTEDAGRFAPPRCRAGVADRIRARGRPVPVRRTRRSDRLVLARGRPRAA